MATQKSGAERSHSLKRRVASVFCAEVPVAKVPQAWHDVLLAVQLLVHGSRHNLELGELLLQASQALGASNDVEEHDLVSWDTSIDEDLDGLAGAASSSNHWVHLCSGHPATQRE